LAIADARAVNRARGRGAAVINLFAGGLAKAGHLVRAVLFRTCARRRVRCAICSRKVSGKVWSIRSMCATPGERPAAHVAGQKHEGRELLSKVYHTADLGGHLGRPALRYLVAAVDARLTLNVLLSVASSSVR
jgi:hypothetical protein